MSDRLTSLCRCAAAAFATASMCGAAASGAEYVVHISVDGLRPDAITNQTAAQLPNFYRLRTEGAFTDNARTDFTHTITLPNHTSMLTGRPVSGAVGHNYTDNDDPTPGQTTHSTKGSYVASAFDVAHDNGLRTGMYTSKSKFSLYDTSYDGDTTALQGGAPDTAGADNGRDKIDSYFFSGSSTTAVATWAADMNANPFDYSFIHIHNPDTEGHANGWDVTEPPTSAYMNAVRAVDVRLGTILNAIESNSTLDGNTVIILSADHGGTAGTTDHGTATNSQNYTIPFYVWGPGVTAGADLYALNAAARLNPGTGRPDYAAPIQPIRNGDGGNLALDLLGLGAIPGSTINAGQNMIVPEPVGLGALALASMGLIRRCRRR